MKWLHQITNTFTLLAKWISLATLIAMTLLITVAVISRAIGHPVIGDVEISQLLMVALIMFGLPYTQSRDAHISIGLIVDRLPIKIQGVLNVISSLTLFFVCWLITVVFVNATVLNDSTFQKSTDLLSIPHLPFKIFIAVGFGLWGLQALLKVIDSIVSLINLSTKQPISDSEGKVKCL
ncbi:TRAP-type C4-dicarboxylate transport system, small permease component [Thalassobacillus cyri]|uniref:TRAP-type C4-dicarboxylate transport system, small permease component n=1 Tax=Thalassobacillus cyri TaxID=571932 RepID=A0A1H4A8Q4_9BACI|nr:TRAP transporter small permease [Thalassobacillus cyri]SEA32316.1 TRAP-type C4-dicarboxylate transport system, small permease component [Thalassobacillus cyri]